MERADFFVPTLINSHSNQVKMSNLPPFKAPRLLSVKEMDARIRKQAIENTVEAYRQYLSNFDTIELEEGDFYVFYHNGHKFSASCPSVSAAGWTASERDTYRLTYSARHSADQKDEH